MANDASCVLVTGGAGFIGSHTVDLLLEKQHQVIVLDNLSTGKLSNLDIHHPNLTFIKGDILDYDLVKKIVCSCNAVLHLAAIVSVQKTIEDPIHSFKVNTQGHLHLLQAIQEIDRTIRFVYISSAAVYGEAKNLPCLDDKPLQDPPLSPYALQKINNEQYAQLFSQLYNMNTQGLRYFNVYGPRQDPSSPYSGVISRFMDAYRDNSVLTVYGDGNQSRDFIYVADVARANYLALQSKISTVVNIATGQANTLLSLIKHIETAGGKPASVQFLPPRIGDIYHSYANTQSATNCLDFTYSISLEEGIRRLLDSSL